MTTSKGISLTINKVENGFLLTFSYSKWDEITYKVFENNLGGLIRLLGAVLNWAVPSPVEKRTLLSRLLEQISSSMKDKGSNVIRLAPKPNSSTETEDTSA